MSRSRTEVGCTSSDVWDLQESFDAFGQTLMPILAEIGIDPGQPQVSEIHNIVPG